MRSGQVDQAQQTKVEHRGRGTEPGQTDSVSLSSLGTELARSLATESPTELRRVDEVRQAVNNGSLNASSQETATRLVDEALRNDLGERSGIVRPASPT